MEFWGYRRPDGKVGVRNHVLVIATVGCAGEVAKKVADALNGTVSFISQGGCAEAEKDLAATNAVLLGMIANPNVYGTIAIGLGCEFNNMPRFLALARERTCKPIVGFTIQEEGAPSIPSRPQPGRRSRWYLRHLNAYVNYVISPNLCSGSNAAGLTPRPDWFPTR